MVRKGDYSRTIKTLIKNNPGLDIESHIDPTLEKSEFLGQLEKNVPGVKIGKECSDEEWFKLQEQEQGIEKNGAWLEAYNNLLHEAERELGRLVRINAAKYVSQLYLCLTEHGFSPVGAKRKIYKDCRQFWDIDTIREQLPDECKDKDRQRAAKIGNAKRKVEKKLELPEGDEALARIDPRQKSIGQTLTKFECYHCCEEMKLKEGFGPINTYYECPKCKSGFRIVTRTITGSLSKYFQKEESNLDALHNAGLVDDKLYAKLNNTAQTSA